MNAPLATHPTPPYKHTPLFPLGKDATPYRKLSADGLSVERVLDEEVLVVPREALRVLAEAAFTDINHLLRPTHLASLKAIVEDPEASDNDKFVAYDFLKNANIAAGGVLPMCQDTGTAIIMGKKGRLIWTDGDDEAALAEGARDAYLKRNLRYSQLAPISMFEEKNTRSNMPAQVEIYAEGVGEGDAAYKFLFIAKGGGSANKSFLFQATPAILSRERMLAFLKEKVAHARHRGVPALPSRHRHRRHLRRADDEDGQARLLPILRRAAGARLRRRPRLPRPRDGARDPQDDAGARRRRAVRRQVFLP
jgi:fumarate hydratase, class I